MESSMLLQLLLLLMLLPLMLLSLLLLLLLLPPPLLLMNLTSRCHADKDTHVTVTHVSVRKLTRHLGRRVLSRRNNGVRGQPQHTRKNFRNVDCDYAIRDG